MTTLEKVLYTAHAHTTGGRDGKSKTDDGRLDVTLSSPGTSGTGTNPEQLFAAGYAACFIGAMKAVGGMKKIDVPADVSIDSSVDLGKIPNGYGIAVRLDVTLPGMDRVVQGGDRVRVATRSEPRTSSRRGLPPSGCRTASSKAFPSSGSPSTNVGSMTRAFVEGRSTDSPSFPYCR